MRSLCAQTIALICAVAGFAATSSQGCAQEPFYKGKRLTVLVNYAPGGSTDAEGRVFARHIGRHIEGNPAVIVQNMDGAGGLVGAKYVGEVAPRDGTVAGYFTATAFLYALEPERFRVDFKDYEFVAIQPGTSINFVRADVSPGMKQAADIVKAQNLIIGALAPDSSKGTRMRLAFDMLGVPYRFISGYRSGGAAKLALQRGEINFFGESPPGYFGSVEPGLIKTGEAIPVYYEPVFDGTKFSVPEALKGVSILPFHEFYETVKGTKPSGRLWEIYKSVLSVDGAAYRLIAMPPGAPPTALAALRAAIERLNSDRAYAEEAGKVLGFVPIWQTGPDVNQTARTAMSINPEVRASLADYIREKRDRPQ